MLSLEQTLQGAAPGVMVTQASSAPGRRASIRIRGGSSVTGNNEPLYVIDGFPVENDPEPQNPSDGGRESHDTVPSNPLAALNPERHRVDRDPEGCVGDVDLRRARRERRHHHHDEARPDGAAEVHARYLQRNAECGASLRPAQRRSSSRQFVNTWSQNNGTGVVFARPDFPAQHRLADR